MLFARQYGNFDYAAIRKEITEDMRRGYSFWAGEHDPTLDQDPGIRTFDEIAAYMPEKAEDLASINLPPESRGDMLAGLCAVCCAQSFPELAQRIWKDFDSQDGWIRGHHVIIAIFEGEPAGKDPSGWYLFTPRQLLAIAHVKAIRRDA